MIADLKKRTNYPKDPKVKLYGTVLVSLVINKEGAVLSSEVVRGLSGDYDKEALIAVNNIGRWNAAVHHGKKVKMRHTVPVSFLH